MVFLWFSYGFPMVYDVSFVAVATEARPAQKSAPTCTKWGFYSWEMGKTRRQICKAVIDWDIIYYFIWRVI